MRTLDAIALAADFATVAYPSQRSALDSFSPGFTVVPFHAGIADGLIGVSKRERLAILAIAGSDESLDWIRNSHAKVHLHHDVGRHQGFFDHALEVREAVHQLSGDIRRDLYSADRVILTGHSQGGAAAIHAADLLPFDHVSSIITFGAPRTLRVENAYRYEHVDKVIRCVRPGDIVPDVPLRVAEWFQYAPVGGWAHVGANYWFHEDGRVTTEESATWQYWRRIRRAARYWIQPWSQRREQAVRDHDMQIYRQLAIAARYAV